jgi:hypothetical protein
MLFFTFRVSRLVCNQAHFHSGALNCYSEDHPSITLLRIKIAFYKITYSLEGHQICGKTNGTSVH